MILNNLKIFKNLSHACIKVNKFLLVQNVRLYHLPPKVNKMFINGKANFVPKRNIYNIFKKDTLEDLRIRDNVPDAYNLIYRNTMTKYLQVSQIVAMCTTAIVTIVLCTRYSHSTNSGVTLWGASSRSTENEALLYVSAFYIIMILLQLTVSRLPIRIYKAPQSAEYKLMFFGNMPFSLNSIRCKAGEIVKTEEHGILPWKDCRYLIRDNKPVILIDYFFKRPADLNIMLGYQEDDE